jgi:hypothetical protein
MICKVPLFEPPQIARKYKRAKIRTPLEMVSLPVI